MTVASPVPSPLVPTDIAQIARRNLPEDVWDFLAGGAGDESTMDADRAALERIGLVPKVLRGVSECDLTTELCGTGCELPLAVAPIAYHRMYHPDGEIATARAAGSVGVPMTIGTLSSVSIEDIAETGCDTWFQLYWLREPERRHRLIARAEAAGCRALVVTADTPWMGRRLRDMRHGFTVPDGVVAANLIDGPTVGTSVATHTRQLFDPTLNWDDLARLRQLTSLPIILKGVLDPDDARRAVDCGASAVVVSTHGGRQMDTVAPAAIMLSEVATAVSGQCQVLFDSGIRGGADIARVLASGADGVLIGRPAMWGLAANGAAGVEQVLDLLADELRDTAGLAGCRNVTDIKRLRTVPRHTGRIDR